MRWLSAGFGILGILNTALGGVPPCSSDNQAASSLFLALEDFNRVVRDSSDLVATPESRPLLAAEYARSIRGLASQIDHFVNVVIASAPEALNSTRGARLLDLLTPLALPFGKDGPVIVAAEELRRQCNDSAEVAAATMSLQQAVKRMQSSSLAQKYFVAGAIYREIRFVDSARQNWTLEHGTKGNQLPDATELPRYLPPGILRESAEHGCLRDSLHNPITLAVFPDGPFVSPQSVTRLSDVVTAEFWKPYTAEK